MAQSAPRTIQVQGRAKISCKPDTVAISFSVSAQNELYSGAFDDLNKIVETLRQAIEKAGIDRTLLKTSSFNIEPTQKKVGKSYVFAGYLASHEIRIEIPAEKDALNRLLAAIVKTNLISSFSMYFSVKNSMGYRDQVLSDAVAQAKHNAEILAKAAGVTLGPILQIQYGWSEVVFSHRSGELACADSVSDNCGPDIEPEDIDISESVTMVFEIA
jgi:hypothetical protein